MRYMPLPDMPLDNTDTFSASSLALAFSVLIKNNMPAYLSQRRGSEQLFTLSFVSSLIFLVVRCVDEALFSRIERECVDPVPSSKPCSTENF